MDFKSKKNDTVWFFIYGKLNPPNPNFPNPIIQKFQIRGMTVSLRQIN
jgi:hypothetical protein